MKWIRPLLPARFDKNELYTLVIFILICTLLKMLPKKMNTSFYVFLYILNVALTVLGDYLLAGNPLNLYDTLDRNSGELVDFILHLFVYPITIEILTILYGYLHEAHPRKWITYLFILLSPLLLVILEWVSAQFFNLFTYFSWNYGYSFIVYLITVSLNILTFTVLTKYYKDHLIHRAVKN